VCDLLLWTHGKATLSGLHIQCGVSSDHIVIGAQNFNFVFKLAIWEISNLKFVFEENCLAVGKYFEQAKITVDVDFCLPLPSVQEWPTNLDVSER